MTRAGWLVVAALALGACKKSSPAEQGAAPGSGSAATAPTCADAGRQFESWMKGSPAEAKRPGLAAASNTSITEACTTFKWPAAVVACIAGATGPDATGGCIEQLDTIGQASFNTALEKARQATATGTPAPSP